MRADPERLLSSGEVAEVFRVTDNAVRRWSDAGQLPFIRTPGGTRRFRARDVLAVIDKQPARPEAGVP
jgi:excisionase family DNA binding protein